MASELQPLPSRLTMSTVEASTPAGVLDREQSGGFDAPVALFDARGSAAWPALYQPSGRETSHPGIRSPIAQVPPRVTLRMRLFSVDLLVAATCWIGIGFELTHSPSALHRLGPGIAASAVALASMRVTGLYRSRNCARRADELWRLALANACAAAAFVGVSSAVGTSGSGALVCAAAGIAAGTASRWAFLRWLRAQRSRGRYLRDVVLVGCNEDAERLCSMLSSEPELGYRVVAIAGERVSPSRWHNLLSSDSVDEIPRFAAATGASGVLIVPFALSSEITERAIALSRASDLHVQLWPGLPRVGDRRLRNVPVSGESFFYVEPPITSSWQLRTKRAIDIVGATMGLALSSPVLIMAALLIKLEDRGSVFYRSERVGMHGAGFDALKLRSMREDNTVDKADLAALNERTDGPLFKATHDPRTTKIGRFLRASSIDELPQLWNVLKGTMSLVGPRPALPSEVAEFDDELKRRHSLRPGITGLWQVEARQNPSFNAYRRLDLRYVDNWSLQLDLYVLAVTVPAIISHAFSAFRSRTGRRTVRSERTPSPIREIDSPVRT